MKDIVFTDPSDRTKKYPIDIGELCILCLDDSNHNKNEYAIVVDVKGENGNYLFQLEFYNKKLGGEYYEQKDILFIPYEGIEYNNFIKYHKDIVDWVLEKRRNK